MRLALLTPDDPFFGLLCSLCGEPAVAMWGGIENVAVCRACATGVLPALLADAVFFDHATTDDCRRWLSEATARYWKAVASASIALHRRRDVPLPSDAAGDPRT